MTIRVDAGLFHIATHCVSKEETRYYLQGVHIEPHPVRGAIMVSTDGHRLVCAYDETGDCDESAIILLPKPAFDLAKQSAQGIKDPVTLPRWSIDVADKSASLEFEGEVVATYEGVIIDGTFPDWRRVVPDARTSALPESFNASYMAGFGKLAAAIAKRLGSGRAMQMFSDGTSGAPMLLRWDGVAEVFGVLMPMRSGIAPGLPAFMSQSEPAAKAA